MDIIPLILRGFGKIRGFQSSPGRVHKDEFQFVGVRSGMVSRLSWREPFRCPRNSHGIPFAVSFRNIRPFCPDEVVDIPGRRASSLNSCEFRDRENVGPCPRCLPGPVTSPLPAVQRHQLPAVPANSRGIGGGNYWNQRLFFCISFFIAWRRSDRILNPLAV